MESSTGAPSDITINIFLLSGLLDILEVQAKWVVGKGMVNAEPSRSLIKSYLATGPMEAVDPSRITLD